MFNNFWRSKEKAHVKGIFDIAKVVLRSISSAPENEVDIKNLEFGPNVSLSKKGKVIIKAVGIDIEGTKGKAATSIDAISAVLNAALKEESEQLNLFSDKDIQFMSGAPSDSKGNSINLVGSKWAIDKLPYRAVDIGLDNLKTMFVNGWKDATLDIDDKEVKGSTIDIGFGNKNHIAQSFNALIEHYGFEGYANKDSYHLQVDQDNIIFTFPDVIEKIQSGEKSIDKSTNLRK